MATKDYAYNEGYERGWKGESAYTWTNAIGDSLVNETDSSKARQEGYNAGVRDRMKIDAERNSK